MLANVIMQEAWKKDFRASIRSAIDFSFQDVDELVRLIWTATKAISRAGLGGVFVFLNLLLYLFLC